MTAATVFVGNESRLPEEIGSRPTVIVGSITRPIPIRATVGALRDSQDVFSVLHTD
jgi:hypothetical protein